MDDSQLIQLLIDTILQTMWFEVDPDPYPVYYVCSSCGWTQNIGERVILPESSHFENCKIVPAIRAWQEYQKRAEERRARAAREKIRRTKDVESNFDSEKDR